MIETKKYHNDKTVHVILPKNGNNIDLKFVLGLFNSKLLNYYYSQSVSEEGRAFAQVKGVNVKKLPFILADKKIQVEIIKYVEQLLQLNKDKQNATLPNQLEMIENRIEHAESKINQIIYELYNLTTDEIKLIESK